jgi:hypothetical protein
MKHNRATSYETLFTEIAPASPRELKPNKFALVCFDGDDADAAAWVTTHRTLNEVIARIEGDESDYMPSFVVDLDTGKQWEPQWTVELGAIDEDYFSGEEEEGEEETEIEEAQEESAK